MSAATPDAASTMRRNGKSFWFASLFLPAKVAADAARLYAFCRAMDDLADTAVTGESRARLAQVREDLGTGESKDPAVREFLELAREYELPRDAADYLIATFVRDASAELHLEDESELLRYCYGVAGTVGLLMSPILGVERGVDGHRAAEAAIHLGIAMQMTNIARDVHEDARNHRRYLPGSWVGHLSAQQMLDAPATRAVVATAVARLLDLADRYYASAASGFRFIPSRARRAIAIAAAVYREIGEVLRRRDCAWWQGRVHVSTMRKAWIALRVCLQRSPLPAAREETSAAAERALAGLPGVP